MDQFLKEGKFYIEDFRDAIAKQSFYFDVYMKNLDDFLKKETFLMKFNYLKGKSKRKIKDSKIEDLIDKFRYSNLGFYMQLPIP